MERERRSLVDRDLRWCGWAEEAEQEEEMERQGQCESVRVRNMWILTLLSPGNLEFVLLSRVKSVFADRVAHIFHLSFQFSN